MSDTSDHLPVGLAAGLARTRTALAVGAVVLLAGGATLGAMALERSHTARCEEALARHLGVPVVLGSAEADLSGAFHLRDVRVGDLFAAREVSAAVGVSSLLRGELAADELVLAEPRLSVTIDEAGHSDLQALIARVRGSKKPGSGHAQARKPRRILASGGQLTVSTPYGQAHANGLELVPSEESLRLVTGPLEADVQLSGLTASARFAKGAVDVDWTTLRPTRLLLAAGESRVVSTGAAPLELTELVLAHGTTLAHTTTIDAQGPNGPLHLELGRDDDGARRFVVRSAAMPTDALAGVAPAWLHPVGGVAAVDLHGRLRGQELELAGRVAVQALVVDHPLLAAGPVPLSGQLELEVTTGADASQGRFSLQTGKLVVSGQASAHHPARQLSQLTLDLTVPEVACADALGALPRAMAGPLVGLGLDGRIGGTLHLAVDAAAPEATVLDLALDQRCKVLADGPAASMATFATGGSFVPVGESQPRSLADLPHLDDLPEHVPAAFIAGEDARFRLHHGFDLEQMRLSLAADLAAGKIERGGSTITQQLAKNLFLGRERTLARKLVEAVLAWRLESLGKDRLLELYLGVIELGGGAIGLEEGARRWFGKPARDLSVAEAAFLAALTPAPQSSTRRLVASGGLDPETGERVQVILRSMKRNHLISSSQYDRARHETLHVIAGK